MKMVEKQKVVRICIKKDNVIYKVTTIILLSDGSFKIDVPYCYYNEGLLVKHKMDYSEKVSWIATSDLSQKFKAEIRPQLSIHASGFVQFSGTGINSGINHETGKAKGIGIFSAPLDTPIASGPTAGCSIWGIEHYLKIKKIDEEHVLFEEKDFINRIYKDLPKESEDNSILNSYLFEIFVFPENLADRICKTENGEELTHRFWNYYESPGAIITFPIIRLQNHSSFLGIVPFKVYSGFAQKAKYGFHIGSPSGTDVLGGSPPLKIMRLMYPNDLLEHSEIAESVSYKKEV